MHTPSRIGVAHVVAGFLLLGAIQGIGMVAAWAITGWPYDINAFSAPVVGGVFAGQTIWAAQRAYARGRTDKKRESMPLLSAADV